MKVKATLFYEGLDYEIERDEYTNPNATDLERRDNIEYNWKEGNYSCDCNRSQFIQEEGYDFPTLNCGDAVKMTSFEIL